MRILGICGSLRSGAFNLFMLRALSAVAPPDVHVSIRRLLDVPLFDPEDHAKRKFPPGAVSLREEVIAADAILIATPEYNHSIPGVLKNALEWLHGRPSLLDGKTVAMVSSAPGEYGGSRAQQALRLILEAMGANMPALPEIAITGVREKFDAAGALIDEPTRTALEGFMTALRGDAAIAGDISRLP